MKLIGVGATAEVYEYAEDKVCKLFKEGYPGEYVKHEYENAIVMFQSEVRVPKPYELINQSNRTGIIYEKIVGETLEDYLKSHEDALDSVLEQFTTLHQQVLKQHTTNAMYYKDFLRLFIPKTPENAVLIESINHLPDDDCLLHGDYHFGNVMRNANEQLYMIDCMNICYGPALYDVARTYFLFDGYEKIRNTYLKLMGITKEDIQSYYEVICQARKFEIGE